ncbi:MAG: hypothetical protein J2P37_19195 [Ktedonobacteraceae bacterium]|nr:hypothetical protein [Ktedonobacteraceae bacterium]
MTSIWYEIFPVTLSSQQAVLIEPFSDDLHPPWLIPHQPMLHPNTLVVEQLMAFFGLVFEPDRTIVHSTSWRYEAASDQLILTYLVVLPQGDWLNRWTVSERIAVKPVGAISMLHGDHLAPPHHIGRMHVLAHALDHLAHLYTYDPAIQHVLEPAWHEILRLRSPKAAGYVEKPG